MLFRRKTYLFSHRGFVINNQDVFIVEAESSQFLININTLFSEMKSKYNTIIYL